MYLVTLEQGYYEMEFEFESIDNASNFINTALLNSLPDDNGGKLNVSIVYADEEE